MFNRHVFAYAGGAVGVPANPTLQKTEQRMVRDDVKMRPVRDPYADLFRASERLSAGKSLFQAAALPQERKQPD